jgi:hypothetical protein
MTTDGLWVDCRIYWIFWYNTWLHFTFHCYTHTLVSVVTSSLALLSSGFQRRTFPFLWILDMSPSPNYQLLTTTAQNDSTQRFSKSNKVKVKFTLRLTVSQSVSLIWNSWPDIYYCLTVTVLFLWGALSDNSTGLSFVYTAGPCQRSLSRVRVPWDSRLRFETSLFVASYERQGHGGDNRPRLHSGFRPEDGGHVI